MIRSAVSYLYEMYAYSTPLYWGLICLLYTGIFGIAFFAYKKQKLNGLGIFLLCYSAFHYWFFWGVNNRDSYSSLVSALTREIFNGRIPNYFVPLFILKDIIIVSFIIVFFLHKEFREIARENRPLLLILALIPALNIIMIFSNDSSSFGMLVFLRELKNCFIPYILIGLCLYWVSRKHFFFSHY